MRKFLIVFCLGFLLCSCKNKTTADNNLDLLLKENEYVIVDVRTKEEYNEGHLVDAINIPYDEIDEDVDLDKDKLIFVYCKSGNRSGIAYDTLTSLGFDVYDLGRYDQIELPKE